MLPSGSGPSSRYWHGGGDAPAAREILAAGGPLDALEVIGRLTAAGERDTAVAFLRIQDLIEGRHFEPARSLMCVLLAEHPDDAGGTLLAQIDRTLAPPPIPAPRILGCAPPVRCPAVEWADMPETECSEERAQPGRRHHLPATDTWPVAQEVI